MKKSLFSILMILLVTQFFAQPNLEFKNFEWGKSSKSVFKKAYPNVVSEEGSLIVSETKLGPTKFYAYGDFIDNKLATVTLVYAEKHSNENSFLVAYEDLLDKLSEKYGDPAYEHTDWMNDLYKDDPQKWGFASTIGHVKFESRWNFKDGKIMLNLSGDNYQAFLGIFYLPDWYYENKVDKTLEGL